MKSQKQQEIIKIDSTNLAGYGKVFVESHKEIRSVGFEIIDKTNRCNKFSYEWDRGGDFCGEFFIEMPILWSLSNPYLYGYKAEIKYLDGEISVKEGKFGFRTLGQNSKNITINGKPVYIRGYIRGAKAHDHANLLGLSLKDFYLKNLRQAKKFGFNYVRFHSVVPEEELFEAADEVGMLVHVELRPPHDIYNNLEEMVTTGSAIVPEEFLEETVDKCFNHPLFCRLLYRKRDKTREFRRYSQNQRENQRTRRNAAFSRHLRLGQKQPSERGYGRPAFKLLFPLRQARGHV